MIRLYIEGCKPGKVHLKLDQIHYLKNVMRKKNTDKLEVFYNGKSWVAEIEFPNINVTEELNNANKTTKPILGIASIRKNKIEMAIEKATELGAREVFILKTDRTNHYFDDLPRLNKIAIEACEQSRNNLVPKINKLTTLQSFLELHTNPNVCHAFDRCFLENNNYINNVVKNEFNINPILIGPEGGWSDKEIDLFMQYNVNFVKIHENVLRAETAAISALTLWNEHNNKN
ncbi:16S rRNA (uracil(1498)-N(3))-methyltransferase [Candidatus Nesciobacter abundans]|uniref:Ribosomal RNA small subunit methyltransferase E n=1 Tax=Candidatus Nesciobacter abundans TaxID=2601668 RepID=A0A5C0UGI4_9PROT|nr:RsmE family RNA methyltransferase [Candidatus Nesciobacter abundans]QEK38840.1 16S rRNA (uracil(1498)-N(3))-methyltransferase [Candidatus Nesciobacter abundans]